MIGIYAATNTVTGQMYIGRAVRLEQRLNQHRLHLRKKTHDNAHLQSSYNKYGLDNFTFLPMMACRREDCPFYERLLVAGFKTYSREFGFNLTIPCLNVMTHTPEARAAISAFQTVFQATNHYVMTQEIREKIAARLLGVPTGRKGIGFSKERSPRSGAPKGNKNRLGKTRTEDDRARISASVKARLASDADLRARLSAIRKGKKQSPELIAKRFAWRLKTVSTDGKPE